MQTWESMTLDYCRAHRGQTIRTIDLADYYAEKDTRRYSPNTRRSQAYKRLVLLCKWGLIEMGSLEADGLHHRYWRIPEAFE